MKPCPHCGGERIEPRQNARRDGDARVWMRCVECGACGPPVVLLWISASGPDIDDPMPDRHMTLTFAAAAWDRRDGDPVMSHPPAPARLPRPVL